MIGSELRRFVTSSCHSGAFPVSMLPARKTDRPVRGGIFGGWQTEKPGFVSCVTGSMAVGVVAGDSVTGDSVTGDSVITSVVLMMVGMVVVESVKSSVEVEAIGAVAVDLAEVFIRFIVINWKCGNRLTQIRNKSLACCSCVNKTVGDFMFSRCVLSSLYSLLLCKNYTSAL